MQKEQTTSLAPIERKGKTALATASAIQISNSDDVERVVDMIKSIKDMSRQVDDFFAPQIESAHKTHKILCEKKKEIQQPLKDAESILKKKKTEWDLEQTRMIEEARAAAAAEAEKEEQKRRAALEKKLAKAKTEGQKELIQEEMENIHVHVEQIEDTTKVDGVATQKTYDVEVIDPRALCSAIGDGTLPIDPNAVFTVKLGAIKTYCKMTGITKIPGCRVTPSLIQRI